MTEAGYAFAVRKLEWEHNRGPMLVLLEVPVGCDGQVLKVLARSKALTVILPIKEESKAE